MRALLLTFASVFALLLGCSAPDRTARTEGLDTGTTSASGVPGRGSTLSLSDFAGKWNTRATDQAGTVLGEAELLATSDTSGWTLTFPKQKPIPVRVIAVAGDSIVTETAPYSSNRVKGAQIRVRAVYRLQDGKLVGGLTARYTIAGRDSVAHARVEGTRKP